MIINKINTRGVIPIVQTLCDCKQYSAVGSNWGKKTINTCKIVYRYLETMSDK